MDSRVKNISITIDCWSTLCGIKEKSMKMIKKWIFTKKSNKKIILKFNKKLMEILRKLNGKSEEKIAKMKKN